MQKLLFILIGFLFIQSAFAQSKTENLVIVTLDGMRWQEVFKGVDSAIIANKKFTADSEAVVKNFWNTIIQPVSQMMNGGTHLPMLPMPSIRFMWVYPTVHRADS